MALFQPKKSNLFIDTLKEIPGTLRRIPGVVKDRLMSPSIDASTREVDQFPFPDYPSSDKGEVLRADLNLRNKSIAGMKADIALNLVSPSGKTMTVPQSIENLSPRQKIYYGLETKIPNDAEPGQWEIYSTINNREVPGSRKSHLVTNKTTKNPLGRYPSQQEPVFVQDNQQQDTVQNTGAVGNLVNSIKDLGSVKYRSPEIKKNNTLLPSMSRYQPENRETIRKGILYNENRGAMASGKDLYKEVGEETGDLGKYQASPDTVAAWSPYWLDRQYTKDEFLNDPEAQEKFFEEFLNVVDSYKMTPEEAALAWHTGFGAIGYASIPREQRDKNLRASINLNRKTEKGINYLKTFKEGVNKK